MSLGVIANGINKNCIHHIYAGIEESRTDGCISISDIILSHSLEGVFYDHVSIISAWSNLSSYHTTTYGAAVRTWHERPFRMECEGQTIVGSIDLVWQTDKGDILIDYKTNPQGESVVTDATSKH